MAKVHRRGVGNQAKKANKQHKRGCRSAPALPTTFTATYIKREVHHREEWKARIKWSPVTLDVAGRPLSVDEYEVQLRATDASGVPIETDGADNDFWSHTEKAHGPTADERCIFFPLPHPKIWYFQARLRVLNRVHGTKCWSAWTGWTTPTQPASGNLEGPPAPTGLTNVLDKVEGTEKHPWRDRVGWNEVGTWTPTGGDPIIGATDYHVQLAASHNGGTTTANVRNVTVPSDPTQTTNKKDFFNIKRKRSYRARVKAKDKYGNWGAYTSWTSWISIGGSPGEPSNVVCTNPTVGILKVTWDPPTDLSDVDGFKVVIRRKDGGAGTIVETDYIGSHRTHYRYSIPFADRVYNHTAKVHSFEDEITLDLDTGTVGWDVVTASAGVESSDTAVDREVDIDELDVTTETRKLIRPSGVPRVRLRRAASQSFSDANDAFMDWDTVDVDTDSFDLGTGAVEIPVGFGGSFRVTAVARWATNGTGRRLCRLQRDTGAGYFDMVTLYDVRGALVGDVTVTQMTNTVQLDAGDKLRVEGWQNSGGNLNVNDASLAVEFLGPA